MSVVQFVINRTYPGQSREKWTYMIHMQRHCPQIEREWYLVFYLRRQGDLYQKDTFDQGGSDGPDPVSLQILISFLVAILLYDANCINQHQYAKPILVPCSANSSTLSKLPRSKIHTSTLDEDEKLMTVQCTESLQQLVRFWTL